MPVHVQTFRERLSKVVDLEKILAKVFLYSVKQTYKAITFENIHIQKLKEFKTLLKTFRELMTTIHPLR